MKNIFEHIEHVKGKPHHIRKQVAFGAATTLSALIAFVWFAGSLATNSFAINVTLPETNAGEGTLTAVNSANNKGIAGAAASIEKKDTSAHIEIVDAVATTSVKKQAEQTTLPF